MSATLPFSGSYASTSEVGFLMRRLHLSPTSLPERERLIQSGQSHYSEMIGPEDAPTRERVRLFRESLTANGQRMADDIATLATALAASATDGELTLVSIARAGTPIGVLLWHRVREIAPHLRLSHYSISVIRDRGVDCAALRWIMARHNPGSLRFVDGWTGKGTIAVELQRSIAGWKEAPPALDSGLWVPLDVCGAATFAASTEDYLIPSTLLGGTISGLVSRSVLPAGEDALMHGCVPLPQLRRYDLSRWFVGTMRERLANVPVQSLESLAQAHPNPAQKAARQAVTKQFLDSMLARHGMSDRNRIKLGIGETVRVLLRRLPQVVWLNSTANPTDAALIRRLAALRQTPVQTEAGLTFDAVAVIDTATP
jgi:hypothetical protein